MRAVSTLWESMLEEHEELKEESQPEPEGVLRWSVIGPILVVWNVLVVVDFFVLSPSSELGGLSAIISGILLLFSLGLYFIDGMRILVCQDLNRFVEVRRWVEAIALVSMLTLLVALIQMGQ